MTLQRSGPPSSHSNKMGTKIRNGVAIKTQKTAKKRETNAAHHIIMINYMLHWYETNATLHPPPRYSHTVDPLGLFLHRDTNRMQKKKKPTHWNIRYGRSNHETGTKMDKMAKRQRSNTNALSHLRPADNPNRRPGSFRAVIFSTKNLPSHPN